MEKKEKSRISILTNGLIKENPVLVLLLGTCPSLAVTTQAANGLGMGLAATFVLVCSNAAISLLKGIIPEKARIPSYIVLIAGFVTVVQLLVQAYAPALDSALGIYLPLIVVNCIILGRAEMFASKNNVVNSILDGIGMGLGFTLALIIIGSIRELLGAGTWFGLPVLEKLVGLVVSAAQALGFAGVNMPESLDTLSLALLPAGGFFIYGSVIALINRITKGKPNRRKAQGCAGCAGCAAGQGDQEAEEVKA